MIDRLARPTPGFAALLVVMWLSATLLFFVFSAADIAVSTFFFETSPCDPGANPPCGRFWPLYVEVLVELRGFFHVLPMIAVTAIAIWIARDLYSGHRLDDASLRLKAALVGAFALGPGLMVNVVLKDHWGRPRPRTVDLFGGKLPFEPAGSFGGQCHDNCSFVSGEAAGVFILPLIALLAPPRWRGRLFAALAVVALAASLLRVAFGAHFLSDAVLGGLSTIVVFAAVAAGLERLAAARRAQ